MIQTWGGGVEAGGDEMISGGGAGTGGEAVGSGGGEPPDGGGGEKIGASGGVAVVGGGDGGVVAGRGAAGLKHICPQIYNSSTDLKQIDPRSETNRPQIYSILLFHFLVLRHHVHRLYTKTTLDPTIQTWGGWVEAGGDEMISGGGAGTGGEAVGSGGGEPPAGGGGDKIGASGGVAVVGGGDGGVVAGRGAAGSSLNHIRSREA
ncbi:hypothetical protein L1987_04802 [Smallanthus sonchifolius]|uniref:Uncharacterized protein n=1 Tax=Smallanthus sonchifolius TaxID=185202 RepID=A0ACB9JTS1_9ASTR|nr:hypothetical protein L1987_04802 [Smallanthus sonchifolius]